MSTEKCKICGLEETPWAYIPKWKGHGCADCCSELQDNYELEVIIKKLLERIERLEAKVDE